MFIHVMTGQRRVDPLAAIFIYVEPMRQEPTRAGRKRQQRREVTLGKLLWRDEILAGRRRREVTLAGRRRREVTLAGRRRLEVTLAGRL